MKIPNLCRERHAIPIYLGDEMAHEHKILCAKERYGDVVTLLIIASIEPIGEREQFHQIGPCSGDQVIIRQSLLDALAQPAYTGQTDATSGYMFGRNTKEGGVIVDGIIYTEDLSPGLIRLDPSRTVEGILEERMRTLGVTLVGTVSNANYFEGRITERGVSEKKTDMPHIFLLDRNNLTFKEVAVVTPKQGGGEVHVGIKIVEHGNSVAWGLVTSVQSVKEPPVRIKLL